MTVMLGNGVKQAKADKALAKAGPLAEGESVWFFGKCNNFRPTMDCLAVTNARVLGISAVVGLKLSLPIPEIASCRYDAKKRTVQLVMADGRDVTFKTLPGEDVPVVQHYLEYARANPAPRAVLDEIARLAGPLAFVDEGGSEESGPVSPSGVEGLSTEESRSEYLPVPASSSDEKALAKEQRRRAKEAAKADKARVKAAQEAADLERAGHLVESGSFGGKLIKIYAKGYVRVGGVFGTAALERLVSIEATSDVSKKSAAGRGAAALATGGLNLMGSNKRGDVYLTIATERDVHVLRMSPPTAMNMKASKKLEAAGNAVLRAVEAGRATVRPTTVQVLQVQPAAPQPSEPAAPGVADRLRELNQMRDEGLIDDEEFASLRARLLGSL